MDQNMKDFVATDLVLRLSVFRALCSGVAEKLIVGALLEGATSESLAAIIKQYMKLDERNPDKPLSMAAVHLTIAYTYIGRIEKGLKQVLSEEIDS